MRDFFVRYGLFNNRRTYAWRLGMLASILLLTSCPGTGRNAERLLSVKVLSDFIFVGSGPYDIKTVPPHDTKSLPMPSHFKAGYQYVFHHKKWAENANVYKDLRTRLLAEGFQITSPDGTMDRYVGGPVFRIAFQGNGLKGFISNVLDGQILNNEALSEEWSIDDYVLVIEEL